MSETIIKLSTSKVEVESTLNGVKSYKQISPDDLMKCIGTSYTSSLSTGLLPKGCLSYSEQINGYRYVCLAFQENKSDITYLETVYKNFPLPQLVFGFTLNADGKVTGCNLGITSNASVLSLTSKMYKYPFSNVSEFNLCIGNNIMPKCESMHSLVNLPYFIMSMPNNDERFSDKSNKLNLDQRQLYEILKGKTREYYYSDILIPYNEATLEDFIYQRSVIS